MEFGAWQSRRDPHRRWSGDGTYERVLAAVLAVLPADDPDVVALIVAEPWQVIPAGRAYQGSLEVPCVSHHRRGLTRPSAALRVVNVRGAWTGRYP